MTRLRTFPYTRVGPPSYINRISTMEKTPKLIAAAVIVIGIICGLGVYAYLQFREYLRGPVIVLTEPENGALFVSPLITVAGKAENAAFLTLNGKQIFTDEAGNFREQLLLQEGYTILAIDAKDRFGRTAREILELVYRPPPVIPASPSVIPAKAGIQSQ